VIGRSIKAADHVHLVGNEPLLLGLLVQNKQGPVLFPEESTRTLDSFLSNIHIKEPSNKVSFVGTTPTVDEDGGRGCRGPSRSRLRCCESNKEEEED